MTWLLDFLTQLREVFLVMGFLLLIVSYFNEGFNPLGVYYISGIFVLIFSFVLYILNSFKKV